MTNRETGSSSDRPVEDDFDEPGMKYRDFLEGVGAAIFAIDLEGHFLFINGRALQLLGYAENEESELVGEHFSKIMAPEQAPAAVNLLQSGREVRPAVLEALRKDGTPLKLEVSGAWVKRRGRRVGALAMAWEVGAAKAGIEQEFSKLDMTILQLLSSGLSNREIAQRVYLSTHTIKDRIERMMRYFDVHRRTELAAIAARQGLV